MHIRISDSVDLVFSSYDEDETGSGWYFTDYNTDKVSESFDTKQQAIEAFREKEVRWA